MPMHRPAVRRVATSLLAACALVALAAGCKSAPSQRPMKAGEVDEGMGTLAAARRFLGGRWSLQSFEVFPPGKPPIAVKGSGTLLYDEFGNLKVDIRADETTSNLLRDAGIDIRDGVISSEGRTAVDMQNRTLTYIVPSLMDGVGGRGPLALNRPRYWQVEKDLLTLTTKDDAGKPLSVARWQRSQ